MANSISASEIARETLKALFARKLAPTPDNYASAYQEISGSTLTPAVTIAAKNNDSVPDISWSGIIRDLLRQLDTPHKGITLKRKKEGVETVLNRFSADPTLLHGKIKNLILSWSSSGESPGEALAIKDSMTTDPVAVGTAAHSHELVTKLRELLADTLEKNLHAHPELDDEILLLTQQVRDAEQPAQVTELANHLRKFLIKLELRGGDKVRIQEGLLRLLRLLVENVGELVADDKWTNGQITTLKEIIEQPLDKNTIADAERNLRSALIKQSTLKQNLSVAKVTLKSLMTTFIDRLGNLTESTGDYHSKIESYSHKISGTDNIAELSNILSDIMQDTRMIQDSAKRTHEELLTTRKQASEAAERVKTLEHELEAVSELVREDQLTGALNRRGMEETLAREFKRTERSNANICVALLDIDNFKQLNDTLGHLGGDEALKHLTRVIKETLRPSDSVARYGGEEFLIILPDTGMQMALEIMERLQRELTKKFFMHNNERKLITFSAGVALRAVAEDKEYFIGRADKAMYQAKKTGKNRVLAAI